jgi:hypothetical protein
MRRDFHLQREGFVMKHWTLRTGLTLGAILLGTSAFAITPEELWTKYQDSVKSTGQTIATQSVTRNGAVLEVRGLTLTTGDATASVVQTIPEVNLTDNGDGTVGVTMSDIITVKGTTPADPANPSAPQGAVDMTVTQSGVTMKASGTVDAPVIDYAAAESSIKGTYATSTGPANIDAKLTGIVGGYAFSAADFQTNFKSGPGTISFTSADIPFPVDIGFAELATDVKFPVTKGDTPSPFTFVFKMVDFTLPENVWALADPTGQLPHDAATLVIDTSGMVRLLADYSATPAAGEVPPAPEFSAVSVNEIRLKLVGAELTGNGDLTLDNTDLVTFSGMPAPTGILNFSLTGGNALLDKVTAMGLVPADQVTGLRMMMGIFAAPATDGSDSMTSAVEFKDKGLFVNGQQLQ